MKVSIICVGKIKEKFFSDAVEEYRKRISRFAALEVKELADESIPQNASEKQAEKILLREGERILAALPKNAVIAAMCIEGKLVSSEDEAEIIRRAAMDTGHIAFIIGGSLGLSDEVKRRADLLLSFGRITLPHRLMRVVLAEQIYRAFMINSGSAYHK